jgi:hypothetical protein
MNTFPRGTNEREGKLKPNQKGIYSMKNSTMNAIYTALTNYGYNDSDVMTELYNEIHRNDKVKAEKASIYERAKEAVFQTLRSLSEAAPLSEIYEDCKDNLPEGFSKAQLQYGLTRLWRDEVTKVEGKVNAYIAKA